MKNTKALFLIIFASAVQIVAAAGLEPISKPLHLLIKQLNANTQETIPPTQIKEKVEAQDRISFSWYWGDMFDTNATSFEYKNYRYSITIVFERGVYNEETKEYVSIPNLILFDTTNPSQRYGVFHIDDFSLSSDYNSTDSFGNRIRINNDSNTKTFSFFFKGTFQEKLIFSITHAQLLKNWAEKAEKHKAVILGKTYYFIPQAHGTSTGLTQLTIAATEGTPLYPSTGLAQDVVSLLHLDTNRKLTGKKTAYSIPLGIKFRLIGDADKLPPENDIYWQIEEMRNEDLYDALDDEALDAAIAHPK